MIRAVVFDLDDTLYPERAYALGGFRAVATQFCTLLGDREAAVAHMVQLMDEGFRGRIFNELMARRGVAGGDDLIARMVEAYRTHTPQIQFHQDAEAALPRLRGDYRLGIITDGAAVQQWAKIDALGLRRLVDAIIVTNELNCEDKVVGSSTVYCKPHPMAYELMAERLHAAPSECAYVADNPSKDFVAPNALGWLTVQVCRRDGLYCNEAAVEGGEPRHRIHALDELDKLLAQ